MNTAILISGYLRNFKTNIVSIKNNIIDKFENVDIYIHLTKNENADDVYVNYSNVYEDIKFIDEFLKPNSLMYEPNIFFSENIKENNVINSWLKLYKLNEIKKINEATKNKKYDLVIKIRPDINFISTDTFSNDMLIDDLIKIPISSKIDKTKLENIDDKYMCDSIAFGKSHLMDRYMSMHEHIFDLIKKHGTTPETLLHNFLIEQDIRFELIDIKYEIVLSKCNIFAICGDSGSGKTTLGDMLKKYFSKSFLLECDRYHKWERGDENWNNFTHLNPESNFLSKMNEDIFDLKIGNRVYSVDYNHKTGKFTEPSLIEPTDNMIVCGLHSLYVNNENMYNLKIFVDTDENLKNKWKIKRDVLERNHSVENVLKQIEKRKGDFDKYIYPQKYKSDIIINFFDAKKVDLENIDIEKLKLENDENISLNLLVHKKFLINKPIDFFKKMNVDFLIESNGDFNRISFFKFKSIKAEETKKMPLNDNFYDYIIFFILNLI